MKTLIAIATALVFALSIAACGGDDDLKPNATDAPTATANDGGDDDGGDDDGDDATPTEDSGDGDDDGDDEPIETPNLEEQGDLLNACDLLTKEEVEEVMGTSVGEPDPSYLSTFSDCSYDPEDFSFSVSVSVFQGGRDAAEALFEFGQENNEEIDDIGRDAQWDSDIGYLEVLEGDYEFSINLFSFNFDEDEDDDAQALERAKTLARKVIERLP